MFSLFLFWFCTDERFWNFCSLCYGIFYLFLAVVLGFKDRVIQKNNLHVCHKKGTKLEERNSFTNFFLINQLCLSTGIKKNPICEKDCMKIKLSVMSCSCMAIALWWHYWMFVLMTVNRLFPVSGYTQLSRVFSLVFITFFIPVFHLGPHHKVLSQGAPLLFFLDFNLQLFFSK